MKSLYNKSGILPALFANSRVDCGIAWSEHRKAEKVKRDDTVKIEWPEISFKRRLISDEGPPPPDPMVEYLKETMAAMLRKMRNKKIPSLKELSVNDEILKPIDPATIKPGDTVRLVGSSTITEWPKCNLDVGEDYKVKVVDKETEDGMTVGIYPNEFGLLWIYDEDLMLVESA